MSTEIDREIAAWRTALQAESQLPDDTLQELEDHLRDEVESLMGVGLTADEALLIGLRRIGGGRAAASELAHVDSDRMWRHFSQAPAQPAAKPREILWVVGAAVLAACLAKVPMAFGVAMDGAGLEVYARNLSLFVVPVLMVAYYVRSRFSPGLAAVLGAALVASTLSVNLYPFVAGGATSLLAMLHLPLLMWLAVGLAYTGDDWRTVRAPLDFIRFTGEFFLYSVLMMCGVFVLLMLFTLFFSLIGLDVTVFVRDYLGISLLVATPVVAAYLVEQKRSLIENLAPAMARIFIPLFLLMMVAFLVAAAVRGLDVTESRELLITIDVLLLLVVAMVIYDLSARLDAAGFSLQHGLNLALIVAALVIDAIALYGIAGRLGAYGLSPNKLAALGENLLLLGNLVGLAVAYARFAAGRTTLEHVLRVQVRYLPAYLLWLGFVVFVFPPLFGFR